jgi:CRISPR/Cas system CSM-associated protein Csm3 (group 7 of RAMP superfamily)
MTSVETVHLIKVTITCEQGLSITSPESAGIKGVDLPIVRDPFNGNPYVPTTGVIGSLRDHARRSGLADEALVRVFGGRSLGGADIADEAGDALRPSLIRAMGTVLSRAADPQVRTQTAIGRFRATAVDGSLRTREHLPAGSTVDLYLSLVGPTEGDLALVRETLASWRPVLGGGRGVGFGAAAVSEIRHRGYDLSTESGLAEWLEVGGPGTWRAGRWDVWAVAPARSSSDRDITFSFRVDADLMIGTGRTRDREAAGRVATTVRDDRGPFVPGSTLKGVFRSRAEFILRTLGLRACDPTHSEPRAEPDGGPAGIGGACTSDPCLICRLFGHSGARGTQGGQRTRLDFADARIEGAGIAERAHVAIDRFTGGQTQGLLFNQEVVESGAVTVRITVAPEADIDLVRGLLSAVALDIHDGFVGLGHGTARGMGDLRLDNEQVDRLRAIWLSALETVEIEAGPRGDAA